jgi:uncharacterized protein DUF3761
MLLYCILWEICPRLMKLKLKPVFWAIGIIGFLAILGGSSSSNTAVKGIQTTITPTIEATASITAVPITQIPTATPTKKPIYIAPTSAPTPIPTTTTTSSQGLSNDNYYTNSDGNEVHSPAYSNSVPAGATAICGDETYSFSQSRRGTCSHHGGVSQWL